MNCKKTNSNSEIVLKTPKRPSEMQFHNTNKKEITQIHLDFCKERKEKYCDYKTNEICPTKKGKFCDYLIIDEKGTEYFIELKGKKVLSACEQIEETIKKLSKNYQDKKSFFAFIIATACPLPATEIQKIKLKFKNNYKCTLEVKNTPGEHTL